MRRRFWLGFALAAAIAAGSVALALVVHERESDGFQRELRDAAQRSAGQARSTVALSVGRLATAGAFFRVVVRLSLDDFGDVGGGLLRGSAFDAAALVEPRARCCAVTYLNAAGAEARVRRIDVGDDPRHLLALRRARDSGRPAATSLAPALFGSGAGLLVYQPIYRDDANLGTTARRRATLVGFAVGVIRPAELVRTALRTLPDEAEVALRGAGGGRIAGSGGELDEPALASFSVANRTITLAVAEPGGPSFGLPVVIGVVGLSLGGILAALVLVWSRHERMVELQRQASHDPLTGLKNRRRFSEDLRAELARSRRHGSEGAVMMLDVDHFKRVNDTLGHPTGDRVIAEIAAVLGSRMRETDIVGRLGGDEFGVVLPHCDREEAQAVAAGIATAVREHKPREGVPPVTVSIGIALYRPAEEVSGESLLAAADEALYEAKRAGRDSIRLAGETATQPQYASD